MCIRTGKLGQIIAEYTPSSYFQIVNSNLALTLGWQTKQLRWTPRWKHPGGSTVIAFIQYIVKFASYISQRHARPAKQVNLTYSGFPYDSVFKYKILNILLHAKSSEH